MEEEESTEVGLEIMNGGVKEEEEEEEEEALSSDLEIENALEWLDLKTAEKQLTEPSRPIRDLRMLTEGITLVPGRPCFNPCPIEARNSPVISELFLWRS